MSKYTTEVRFICENYAGLKESVGYTDVNRIVEAAYPKIFDLNMLPMFNGETQEHRALLFKKILLKYYTREIAYETVGLWKQKLNYKLLEILPYYNQLYESELLKYNPLENVSHSLKHDGTYHDNQKDDKNHDRISSQHDIGHSVTDTNQDTTLRHSKTTEKGDNTRTNNVVSNSDTWTLFSDTPQGGINGIANGSGSDSLADNAYLSNATHVIGKPDESKITDTFGNTLETYNKDGDKTDNTHIHSVTDSTNDTDFRSNDTEINDIDKNGEDSFLNVQVGKHGSNTYASMIQEWRDTFLNIDKMIIDELDSLFLQIW